MSGDTTAVEHIDAADAFARTLFVRARLVPSPAFLDIAEIVRQLHLALRHLRVEAADPDSLINSSKVSMYARQLRPIVEDCDFTLKQLETVLEQYNAAGTSTDAMAGRVAAIRAKLATEKTNVDMFLDTVQLHNPATRPVCDVQATEASLEGIKDRVDNIAQKLFRRRHNGLSNGLGSDDDGLWKEFEIELEKDGFAPQVLHKHKEVLRAYIRELESVSNTNGGAPPTVRGLLERQQIRNEVPPPVPPKERMFADIDGEKYPPGMKRESRRPESGPELPRRPQRQNLSFDRQSDSSEDSGVISNSSLTLISTRDLMAMDNISSGMATMNLQPSSQNGQNYSVSPLPGPSKFLGPDLLPVPSEADLSSSPNAQILGSSPRYAHNLPVYNGPNGQSAPYGSSPRMVSRLAPDRYGKEIPLDAQWTRIKRTLISPEVLERAGVRYEARPAYVAILGHLTRDQIAEYARRSADCRAARSGRPPPRQHDYYGRSRQEFKSSPEEDTGSVLWDEGDTTDYDDDKPPQAGKRNYPFIVNPPTKEKASPSSTVMPKPILKNKNQNHVRFGPDPYEVENKNSRPSKEERDHRREHSSRRRDPRDDRDGGGRYRDSGRRDGDRHRDYDGDHHRSSHRDRERDRRTDRKDERTIKKKAWGETLGAVGIGGAAVSLLGVLAEAAGGM